MKAKTTKRSRARITRPAQLLLAAIIWAAALTQVRAALLYVDLNSASPTVPYSTWATAARNIQNAVDAASAGDEIVVTNGIYQTGGRVVDGVVTNRVAVTKSITLRSVSGPEVTVINGEAMLRCVYLTNGATLAGFTLTNGAVPGSSGGGVWCASVDAVVSNCVVSGNSVLYTGVGGVGGGAFGGTLNNCTLSKNSAYYGGGGACRSTLNNCVLTGNSAGGPGGGASTSTLNNCALYDNSGSDGGGVAGGTLNNCTLTGNSARVDGGGAAWSALNNCTLTGNSARADLDYRGEGGGAYQSTMNNCTLTGNSAFNAGGVSESTLNNSIVYYNVARQGGANYSDSTFNYSCTTPLPPNGVANITAEPQLASASHLSADSPCRGLGSAAYATGADIDGEEWANPPSIGCDEFRSGTITGPLSVTIVASFTNVATRFEVNFSAQIGGQASNSRWEFGNEPGPTNRPYAAHDWEQSGDRPVVLWAYNESYPDGVSSTVIVHVVQQPVHYVALSSTNSTAPYSSWTTAANNIQDAVDAAAVAGALVLVTNGVYQTGGRAVGAELNRVAVTKPLTVRSLNGPEVTMIVGQSVAPRINSAAPLCLLGGRGDLGGFHADQWPCLLAGRWLVVRLGQCCGVQLRSPRQFSLRQPRRRGFWGYSEQLHICRKFHCPRRWRRSGLEQAE